MTPMSVLEEAIERTNAAKPDMVALTGDFVCHSQKWLDELEHVLKKLEAPGFCVLGNHDHWSGADEVRRTLHRAGMIVLDNAWTLETIRGQKMQIVGLDDAYTTHADVRRATKGLVAKLPSIGLSHIGEEADALWAHGIPLVLSGHTHGGQITFARLHEISVGKIAGHKYVHGLYGDRRGTGTLYVAAGIGSSVFPFRVGDRARREIAVFELGQELGTFEEHHAEQDPLPGRKPHARKQLKRLMAVERKRLQRERQG
jgi:predicted MPP superfamily phosphohydrolase